MSNLDFVESILEICNIGLSNQGGYICTAENGTSTITNTTIVVTVLGSKLFICLGDTLLHVYDQSALCICKEC